MIELNIWLGSPLKHIKKTWLSFFIPSRKLHIHKDAQNWLNSTRRQFKYLYTLLEVRSLSGRRRSQRTYHFDESMIFKDQTYFHLPQRTRSWRSCCRRIGRRSADPKQVPHERQHFEGLNDWFDRIISETIGTSRWQTEPLAMRKKTVSK